ncbi:unnamed protein product [Durusdinium trenchii]|uniref:Cyclic nucleotide-binding domain-containing protein n=2 Tax=Durusdinium trenchii TaxID=1381693 RepID=A0ABP0PHI5_9DINO
MPGNVKDPGEQRSQPEDHLKLGTPDLPKHPTAPPPLGELPTQPPQPARPCHGPMSATAVPWHVLSVIREACVLPAEQRSEEQIDAILSFVQDVAFFAELPSAQRRKLCEVISLETFQSRSKIFDIGDHGDKYYIILTGAVMVQTLQEKAADDWTPAEESMETVAQLKEGHGFGELALQDTSLRQATVITTNFTEFLVTRREHYQQFARAEHQQFVKARVAFLRQCPRMLRAIAMSEVTEQEVKVMAQCLREKSLRTRDVLCKQGEPVEFLLLVRSGFLMKLRAVEAEREDASPTPPAAELRPVRSSLHTGLPSRPSQSRASSLRWGAASSVSKSSDAGSKWSRAPSGKLLHLGSLPAFACYGAYELAQAVDEDAKSVVSTKSKPAVSLAVWPFSLVAESTAEVYLWLGPATDPGEKAGRRAGGVVPGDAL